MPQRSAIPWYKRLQAFWRDYEWPIILAIGLIALVLGFIGFAEHALNQRRPLIYLDIFYRTIQLVPMESGNVIGSINWKLQVARFLVPAVAAYAAAKAFTLIFQEHMQLVRLWFVKDHVIICGLGQKGDLLIDHFRARGERVVVIEQGEENVLITLSRDRGAIVLVGDATDPVILNKAAVQRARHLIAVCSEDGINAEVAVHAQELCKNRKSGTLNCTIHIVDPQLWDLLREQELGLDQFSKFRLQLFNIFDRGARLLLQEYPLSNGVNKIPHILVVGLGNLGINLVMQAAKAWQEQRLSDGQRLRITVIDRDATGKLESLYVRYPQLTELCDLFPHAIDIHSPAFERADFLTNGQHTLVLDRAYICLDDNSVGLHTGLALLRQTRFQAVPIVIRMSEHTGLATLLDNGHNGQGAFRNLHAFGLLTQTCTPDLVLGGTHEILARAFHEKYIRQQKEAGQTVQTNPTMAPWNSLPESLKESNRRLVDHIRRRFEAINVEIAALTNWEADPFNFSPTEVELLARMEHERWIEERLDEGWKYAPGAKDLDKKTHPDLVPWEKLPAGSKAWNIQSVQELPDFLARAGFQIYRLQEE